MGSAIISKEAGVPAKKPEPVKNGADIWRWVAVVAVSLLVGWVSAMLQIPDNLVTTDNIARLSPYSADQRLLTQSIDRLSDELVSLRTSLSAMQMELNTLRILNERQLANQQALDGRIQRLE